MTDPLEDAQPRAPARRTVYPIRRDVALAEPRVRFVASFTLLQKTRPSRSRGRGARGAGRLSDATLAANHAGNPEVGRQSERPSGRGAQHLVPRDRGIERS
jgi:hypothetical protein